VPDITPAVISPQTFVPTTPNASGAVKLDPSMASNLPSIFAAVAASNPNDAQINMANQLAGTVQTYKKLSTMPLQQAKESYKGLSSEAQAMVKSMYGDAPFTNMDNLAMQIIKKPINVVKGLFTSAANPIIALYKTAGIEGKIINAPYLFSRELTQGESVFHTSTYSKAWDGKAVFDQGSLNSLQKKYGTAASFVAEGLLKGMKPGAIVDAYGKVDGDLYKALADMYSNTPEFNQMYDEFRAAQVSPGHDISRVAYNVPITDNHFYSTNKWKYTTGAIDAFYELIHDPLTYFGGDLFKITKGAVAGAEASTKGAQLAEKLLTDPVTRAANAEEIFKPGTQVANSWDNVYGPLLQKVAEADIAKDPVAKASVMKRIQLEAPSINDRNFINLAVKAKAFDANGAKEFAKTLQGAQELHMGMVDGPTFMRMGIPIARQERFSASGFNKFIGDYMNGNITDKEIDAAGTGVKAFNAMLDVGRVLDPVTGKPGSVVNPLLDDLSNQMTIKRRITRLMQTHPGHNPIGVMDENVDESIPTVQRYLRLLYPRYAAETMAEAYKYANPVDRTTFVRGLYDQIMNKMGVPLEKRLAILEHKFADTTTFANTKETLIAPQHLDTWKQVEPLIHAPEEGSTSLYKVTTNGPLHSFQGKPQIGGLDFTGPELAPHGFNFNRFWPARVTSELAGGVLRSALAKKITNLWATSSIAPRVGDRGSIEQGIFHYITAPWENLTGFFRGRQLNKAAIGLTGQISNVPYGARLRMKLFGKSLADWVPEKSVYQQIDGKDMKIIQGRMDKGIVNGQELWTAAQSDDIIHSVTARINKLAGNDPETAKIFETFLKYPSASNSASVNSVIARSAIHQGMTGGELDQMLLTKNGVKKMLEELNYVATGDLKLLDPKEIAAKFGETALSAAHYRAWAPMFQRFNVLDGFHFGANFIKHNALRTGADFSAARDEILKYFGVNPDTLKVTNRAAFDKFKNFSMQFGRDTTEKGMTEVQSVVNRIQIGLSDMYHVFHGSPLQFNDQLLNFIKEVANEKGLTKALDAVQYDNFENLTKFNRPVAAFKSDLDFANKGLWEEVKSASEDGGRSLATALVQSIKRFGEGGIQNKILHYMDTQINWLFNQPAFDVAKMTLYKKYLPLQKEMFNQLIKSGYSKELATEISERHFVEVAEKNAAQTVIKFVDNAAKQSVLSYTLRTSGRFYRAQEQYMRRIYRLKDYLPRALWRMRLLHLGIDNMGFLHKDDKGEPYFTMPGDSILFHGINGPLNFIMGRDANVVTTPMFADFNMNLLQSSPSLGPDAGVPAFSGPLMSVPVLALKGLLSHLPWGQGKVASTSIDKILLGSKSANLTWSKILPTSIQRALDAMPKDEQDHQFASAGAMAIAYNAANGYGKLTPLSVHSMNQEQYASAAIQAKKNISATVNNVLFLRSLLGMISPISPTMVEGTKGLPNQVRNTGINSLTQEYNDILQAVLRNSNGISDPYEVALGIFTRDYPGRAVFTVGKSDKQLKLLQTYTQETENWMQTHSQWVNNKNSDIANVSLIFAPHVGQYDNNAYVWMQSMGFIKQKPLDQYLQDVLTAQDDAAYQNAKYREQQGLLSQDANRAAVIGDAQAEQKAILASNPILAWTQGDTKNTVTHYQKLNASLGALINDESFPINSLTRKKMQLAWNLADSTIKTMTSDAAANGAINATATKEDMKQRAIEGISEIGGAAKPGDAPVDPQIAEALRAIWLPLFNNLSKTTLKVGITR